MPQKIILTKLLFTSVILFWLFLTAFALTRLWKFDGAEGTAGHPPAQWQRSVPVALDPARPTLVMLVHPQCPCSRASLTELNRLVALCPSRAAISVLFLRPSGFTPAWTHSALWRQAASIPGVSVGVDDQGAMARRLGAATSGETLLYAPDGRLLYQGGITPGRGHEGDNAGLSAVAALLCRQGQAGQKNAAKQEPVYGCPLTADRRNPNQNFLAGGSSWLP